MTKFLFSLFLITCASSQAMDVAPSEQKSHSSSPWILKEQNPDALRDDLSWICHFSYICANFATLMDYKQEVIEQLCALNTVEDFKKFTTDFFQENSQHPHIAALEKLAQRGEECLLKFQTQVKQEDDFEVIDETPSLREDPWRFKLFLGVAGSYSDFADHDIRGVVAYKKSDPSKPVIAFHGSRDEKDWVANFDSLLVKCGNIKDPEFMPKAPKDWEIHKGFGYIISKAFHSTAEHSLENTLQTICKDQKLQSVIFTGHSQGAGLGALAASYAPYSTLFKNVDVSSYVFSMPRFCSAQTAQQINTEMASQIIRQNVDFDPVTVGGFSNEYDLFRKLDVALNFSKAYISGGSLIQDGLVSFIKKLVETTEQYTKDPALKKGLTLLNAIINHDEKTPRFDIFYQDSPVKGILERWLRFQSPVLGKLIEIGGDFEEVFKYALTNFGDVGTLALDRLSGREEKIPLLDGVWNLIKGDPYEIVNYFAPYHYGSLQYGNGKKGDAAFDPTLPSQAEVKDLLKEGAEHLSITDPKERFERATASLGSIKGIEKFLLPPDKLIQTVNDRIDLRLTENMDKAIQNGLFPEISFEDLSPLTNRQKILLTMLFSKVGQKHEFYPQLKESIGQEKTAFFAELSALYENYLQEKLPLYPDLEKSGELKKMKNQEFEDLG